MNVVDSDGRPLIEYWFALLAFFVRGVLANSIKPHQDREARFGFIAATALVQSNIFSVF